MGSTMVDRVAPAPSQVPDRGQAPQHAFQVIRTPAMADFEAALANRSKVLAVVAPVGYGKTVFLTGVHARLETSAEDCFWVTLEERDTRLEDVLQKMESVAARNTQPLHPTQALFRGDQSAESRIESLIQAMRSYPHPFTAFIDNLHFCTDPRLAGLLDQMTFQTPPVARFAFSSTASLPFNLTRAKLEGLVRQVGHSSLALDIPGIRQLLGKTVANRLDEVDLQSILDLTEGWPAAVRMIQIAIADHPKPRTLVRQFSGSDQDLVALLNRQLLQVMPDSLRDFLLSVAWLHTFDASLCNSVTESSDSQVHIDALVRRNAFIVPLDRARTQFRLHGLFRQCLISEARAQVPAATRQASLDRAARHCEQQERPFDAMEYAIEAQAFQFATQILDKHAGYFVRDKGDTTHFIDWARTVVQHGCTLGWEAEYWFVWGLALNQHYDEARHQLERLARRIQRVRKSADSNTELFDVQRRLEIVRMCIDVFTDALPEAEDKARQWLESQVADDPFDITVARCIRSIHASSIYAFQDASLAARNAQASSAQTGSHYAQGWVAALTALPLILEGQYPKAYSMLMQALDELPQFLGESAGICGTLSLLAASCAVEMDLTEEATRQINAGLRTAHLHGFIDALACGLDAALKLWSGDTDDNGIPDQLQRIVGAYPPRLAYLVSCHLVRRLIRLGRLAEAESEARRVGLSLALLATPPEWLRGPRERDVLTSTLIDLEISAGRGRQVQELLNDEIRTANAEYRIARAIDLLLLAAIFEAGNARTAEATRLLTRAIRLATPIRMIRPFHDVSARLATLIEDTKPSAWAFATADERTFFGELCALLPISDPGVRDRLIALHTLAQAIEPLTPRQTELLVLIEAGLTNQQIADRIDRTLMTVKNHLRGLYGRLGVSNRSAALARAKAMKIL